MQLLRRSMRETAFQLARRDLAMFLKDHEEELIHIFREELQNLDDAIPEENLFIDIKMVPLGEMILRSALRAISRFLTGEDIPDIETDVKEIEQSAVAAK